MKRLSIILVLFLSFSISVWGANKPTLLFYCGITMVKPMAEIAKIIEEKYNCNIKIIQGGSKDLYQSLSFSKKGDLYLPGSESYRINNLKDGYLMDTQYVGYNQAAIFVQKGNPKGIKNLDSLLDESIITTLCNPKSGSIGRMTKNILTAYRGEEFFYDAFDVAVEVGTDSRNLNKALIDKKVDMTINWRATAFWEENSKYIDIVEIDEQYAPKKKLVLNLLKFSKHPELAKKFMEFAGSAQGEEIMKRYGFR